LGLQERERAAEEEAAREHDIALGNPLLNPKSDFNVKRRYVFTQFQPLT
jgi:protein CWC15